MHSHTLQIFRITDRPHSWMRSVRNAESSKCRCECNWMQTVLNASCKKCSWMQSAECTSNVDTAKGRRMRCPECSKFECGWSKYNKMQPKSPCMHRKCWMHLNVFGKKKHAFREETAPDPSLSAATKKGAARGGEQRVEQLHSLRRNECGKPTARGRTYIQTT